MVEFKPFFFVLPKQNVYGKLAEALRQEGIDNWQVADIQLWQQVKNYAGEFDEYHVVGLLQRSVDDNL